MPPPPSASALPESYRAEATLRRIALIAQSHAALLARPVVAGLSADAGAGAEAIALALWQAPQVIVAHGTEPDPLFFFANRAALDRFDTTLGDFVGSPSRLSAEAPLRAERQALLDRVTRHGFIADYAGVRISAKGARFRIAQATVWNLLDAAGMGAGQAATFDRWTDLAS